MEIVASGLAWAGLAAAVVGAVNVAWPLFWLRIRSRRTGALVMAAGLLMFVVAVSLPPRVTQAPVRVSRLDDFVPAWQFDERHTIRVHAPAPRVFRAIKDVTAEEMGDDGTSEQRPREPGTP